MGVGMSDYKELVRELYIWIKDAQNDELTPPIVLRKCKYAIEQLCTDVARLEAENRAKEQYIAETIGKVIKERDAAIADLGKACYINLRNVRANACHFCLKLPICAKISGKQNYCCADWEWRGVQEEENGND